MEAGVCVSVLRESSTLKVLRHPGIAQLIDFVCDTETMLYVLEMCDGGSLWELVVDMKARMSTMPWDMLRSFTRQLLEAVAYMHRCRIAHRDLKTQNVVLHNGQRMLKLCDFGMSRVVRARLIPKDHSIHRNDDHLYTRVCTTLGYRPPELLLKDVERYDPFSLDSWSMGCILFEMIRLCPFVNTKTEMGALNSIFSQLGTPTEATWPGVSLLVRVSGEISSQRLPSSLLVSFKVLVPPEVMSVLDGLLQVCPYGRMTASHALGLVKKVIDGEWARAEAVVERKGLRGAAGKRRRIDFV
jgi:serine/threonine protein kinase